MDEEACGMIFLLRSANDQKLSNPHRTVIRIASYFGIIGLETRWRLKGLSFLRLYRGIRSCCEDGHTVLGGNWCLRFLAERFICVRTLAFELIVRDHGRLAHGGSDLASSGLRTFPSNVRNCIIVITAPSLNV